MSSTDTPITPPQAISAEKKKGKGLLHDARINWQLHVVLLLPLIYIVVFKYVPMYGAQIAFRDFMPLKGIWGSDWVGIKNFKKFFMSYQFATVMKNTIGISAYSLVAGFPIPIFLALALNNADSRVYKKTVQMATYAPHFISTVVMAGIILRMLSPHTGIINHIVKALGAEPVAFMSEPRLFKTVYVITGIWQNAGWGTIIYLAALSSINPTLHEAALVDGATRVQRTWHIDVPGIMPTAVILLILNTGRIMNVGFEKVFLLQNPLNLTSSEIIQTYVYKIGLGSSLPDYSFATAVGLFNSLINLALLLVVNSIARKLGETSLW